eukprot:6891541-Prymnesium_polylepis.1
MSSLSSSGASQPLCLLVTTGTGQYSSGTLNLGIDEGSGVSWQVTGTGVHGAGSQVFSACYSTFVSASVTNPTTDGWMGEIQFSSDSGTTYGQMVCTGCATGTCNKGACSSPYIFDLDPDNANNNYATTRCNGGATCVFTMPPSPPSLTPLTALPALLAPTADATVLLVASARTAITPTDWFGIYPVSPSDVVPSWSGYPGVQSTVWRYASPTTNASHSWAGSDLPVGMYRAVLLCCDGYQLLA